MKLGRHGELLPLRGFSRWARGEPPGASKWRSLDGIFVVSGCHTAPLPGGGGLRGPQWLVSVSRAPDRSTVQDAQRAALAFDMPAWDEDNHHPGIARHLWCPIDVEFRQLCECKITETTVVDGDYAWTTDDTEGCRGCDYQRLTGQSCPIHAPNRAAGPRPPVVIL